MKLKKIRNIAIGLAAISIALIQFGCEQDWQEELDSTPVDAAPAVTIAIDSNTDSTLTASYSINVPGRVTLALIEGVDTPAIADLEKRTFETTLYKIHDDEAGQGTITYEGLDPYTQYRMVAMGHNTDGVASEMFLTDVIRTQDFANPELEDYTPAGQNPKVASNQPIVLTFSEPVVYDNTKEVTFSSYFGALSEVVPEDSISISGNVVTISYGILPFNDYCFISYGEGTFTDMAGNPCEEVVSGVIEGYLEGIWFRVETDPATQLGVIFENFLGDFACTDFYNSDSVTVDWGPYSVEITEDEDVEYGVIISNFWAWGVDAKFQFHEDGTITCSEQLLDGVDMGDTHGASYDGYGIWVKGWAPDIYSFAVGHWDYTDFSFDIALSFINDTYGSIYSDIYQSYEVSTSKTVTKGQKTQMNLEF